jgi:hypothetical protein
MTQSLFGGARSFVLLSAAVVAQQVERRGRVGDSQTLEWPVALLRNALEDNREILRHMN